jgi:hypothetical protein
MGEKNTYESLQAGLSSSKAADSQFDPMKGRTYIPRMSPETNKAIIDAIKARRNKKKAADTKDELREKMGEAVDSPVEQTERPQDDLKHSLSASEEPMFAKYGGKVKKYKRGGRTKKYRK